MAASLDEKYGVVRELVQALVARDLMSERLVTMAKTAETQINPLPGIKRTMVVMADNLADAEEQIQAKLAQLREMR